HPAEQLAADHDAGADADLSRDVDEVVQVVVAAVPQLAEGGQVGLVVDQHRQARGGQAAGQDLGHGHLHPAQVGGQAQQPAVGLDRAGHGHGQPGHGEPGGLGGGDRVVGHPHGAAQHLGGGLAPVVARSGPERADLADQVGHADGEAGAVDLQPDADESGAVEDQGAGWPPDPAAGLGTQLGAQAGADQVVAQAGGGGLGESGGGGDDSS